MSDPRRRLKQRRDDESKGPRLGIPASASTDARPGKIRFSFHDMVSGYCISECSKEQKSSLVDALWRRSQFTWAALQVEPHDKLGCEEIPKNAIRAGIPQQITNEVKIWSFRAGLAKRMVGYYDGGVFHVVWLDLKLNLYDHGS